MECVLEVMEQPAERVKFRTEVKTIFGETQIHLTVFKKQVHGHRCQQRELLLGQVRQSIKCFHSLCFSRRL